MEFKGKEGAADYASIPLGYEVKAKGVRNADGALMASKLEAKPNGMAMFESDVIQGTNAAEAEYRRVGHMFQQLDENNVRRTSASSTSPARVSTGCDGSPGACCLRTSTQTR